MFGVLLESRAARPRRPGGALLSLLVHAAAIGTAIVLTVRESPAKAKCAISPCAPIVELFGPYRPVEHRTGTTAGHGLTFSGSTIRAPRPITIDLGNLSSELPHVDIADPGTGGTAGRDFCTKASDCAVQRERTDGAGVDEGIARGPDLVARIVGSPPRPRYPEALRAAGLAGRVVVQFIVDTMGVIEPASVRVVESSHEQFARAVLDVLPRYRFVAAEASGRRVRMTAQMPFEFTLDRR
jgi:protein TonB